MHTAISHYMTQFNQQDLCEADPFSDRLCLIWVKPWNRLSLFEGGFAHAWDWWTYQVSVSMDFNSPKKKKEATCMHIKSVKFLPKLVLTYWNTYVCLGKVSFTQFIISRVNLELLFALLHFACTFAFVHWQKDYNSCWNSGKKQEFCINSMVRSLIILYSSLI